MTESAISNVINAKENTPEIKKNPFQLIAYLLFKVRHSLEDYEGSNRPPRWVRIARAREAQGDGDIIGKAVKLGINGFAEALSYMLELALDMQELFIQTDAAKALAEVSLDFIKAATDENFINGVESLTGAKLEGGALNTVNDNLARIKKNLHYIPEPDDLHGIGHELYRLLCIEQKQLPIEFEDGKYKLNVNASETVDTYIEGNYSGKIRLLQWAFSSGLTTYGLGPVSDRESLDKELFRFGSRWIWKTGTAEQPGASKLIWRENNTEQMIFDFKYNDENIKLTENSNAPSKDLDIKEVHDLLIKLGYTKPSGANTSNFDEKLETKLRNFQIINDLPTTGQLDNYTINRLLNLDSETKNIKRAKPFDENHIKEKLKGNFTLMNPDAEDPLNAEKIEIIKDDNYPYYVVGRFAGSLPDPTDNPGWIIDDISSDTVQGFVALSSRDGKNSVYSEGEPLNGKFFFAARIVEPWINGRGVKPKEPLFKEGPTKIKNKKSRIYQWVPISNVKKKGYELDITCKVHCRSLYTPKDRDPETDLNDQCQFLMEFYENSYLWKSRDKANSIDTKTYKSKSFPDKKTMEKLSLAEKEAAGRREWVQLHIGPIQAPENAAAVLVILEGKHSSGSDIDAYFENVLLTWELKKNPQA